MATFQELYKKLNPAQKQAVDTIEGPVMVVAGPGTGKTQILTLRIANIIRSTDTPPDGILALTFTESGVHSMRKRLVSMIGSSAYKVGIYTFHGFAGDIIRRFPDAFPRIIGAAQIDDVDRVLLLKELIDASPLQKLRPYGEPFYYLHSIRGKISELKRENISPEKLVAIIERQKATYANIEDLRHTNGRYKGEIKGKYQDLQKHIQKNEDLAILYTAYEQKLTEKRLFDYEDMIIEVIQALETKKDLLLSIQEQYLYFLADEHQDANNAQNRLLELLGSFHESPNLFIVGDAKQAIYRFQGASLDNFLYFTEKYPATTQIALTNNYRSVQEILDSAHTLAKKSAMPEHLIIPLIGARTSTGIRPSVVSFPRPEDERLYISKEIKRLIGEGVPPEEIAVLYRTNRDADSIALMFEKHDIPHVVESDQNILRDPHIRKFLALLKAVTMIGNDMALIDALHADFLKIPPSILYRLLRFSDRSHTRISHALGSPQILEEAGIGLYKPLIDTFRMLERYAHEVPFRNPFEIAEGVARESGFIAAALKSGESEDILEKVTTLFETLRQRLERHRDSTLADFMHYIDLINEHDILIKKETRGERKGRVRLMTAHRAKGLEFDYVFIAGVADGHWGNRRSRTNFCIPIQEHTEAFACADGSGDDEDERRLFYVALTRARLGVTISYARENERGEAELPSAFIGDLGMLDAQELAAEKENVADSFLDRIKPRRIVVPPAEDKDYLNKLFLEQGLSVTALDNYLEDPWQYFYQNLLRIPKTPTRHLLYGDAVHEALRYYFEALRNEEAVDEAALIEHFKNVLLTKPLPKVPFEESLARGSETLKRYLNARKPHKAPFKCEWKVETLLDIGNGVHIPLRGKLDKVEHVDGTALRVVDYKTGKAKSRNEIEGKNKNSTGNLKRQLVFYRLLLEETAPNEVFHSGVIDFVEPDEKGRIRNPEVFEVDPAETTELREVIKTAANEILNLSFWDKVCDPDTCEYCDLVETIQHHS